MAVTKASSTTTGNTASRSPGTGTFAAYTPKINDVILTWTSATTVQAVTMISGWVSVLGGNTVLASAVHTVACVYHLVTAAEQTAVTTSWALTNLWNANVSGNAVSIAFRGADPSNPVCATATKVDSTVVTPHVMPGISGATVLDGAWQASCLTGSTTNSYGAAPGGWTFQASSNTNQIQAAFSRNALMRRGVSTADQNLAPTTADEYVSVSVAINPVPVIVSGGLPQAIRRAAFY